MSRPLKKFVSVFLAVWLPLVSGNALAMHTTMLNGGGECPTTTGQQDHSLHQPQPDQSAPHHTQQNSGCNNCGTCHFAGSGYVSTTTITVVPIQLDSLSYPPLSTPFLSFISLLLDPPPLSRA